jgi:hypothetical protein
MFDSITVSLAALSLAAVAFFSFPGREARADDDKAWVALFDGETIEGWTVNGGFAKYEAKDDMIVGTTADGSPNTFLCKGPFGDFELEFDVLCDKELNSGVQIRSQVYGEDSDKKGKVYGYQCEIAPGDIKNCGNFWDEAREGKWWDDYSDTPEAETAFKVDEGTITASSPRAITSAHG